VRHISTLTDDNPRTAEAIARAVGLDDVHAQLKPEDKVAVVEPLDSPTARS
jgi:cation transport ATPase